MKQLIFILCLYVIITAGFPSIDDVTDSLADLLSISKTDVEICWNKTNVNVRDLEMMDQLVIDNVETANIDKSALKVGCLFACLLQKKELMVGTHINVKKIKEEINIKWRLNAEDTAQRNRILDICTDRGDGKNCKGGIHIKSKNNECDVIFKLFLCVLTEVRHHEEVKRHENLNNL